MKDKIVAITKETAGPGEDLRANRRLSISFSSRRLSYSLVILKVYNESLLITVLLQFFLSFLISFLLSADLINCSKVTSADINGKWVES